MFTQVKYHEDFEKMKGTKIEVADNPELRHVKRVGSIVSGVEYRGQGHKDESRRQSLPHAGDYSSMAEGFHM